MANEADIQASLSNGGKGAVNTDVVEDTLPEAELQTDELVLRPCSGESSPEGSGSGGGGSGRGGGELVLSLMHVRDPSVMHKYAKHQKTKCNLWARMWSSSSLLAEILIADGVREHLSDVSAIEIGAGMAVCALTAAVRGGAKIMVTDSSDHALDLVKGSARLNGVADSLSCR